MMPFDEHETKTQINAMKVHLYHYYYSHVRFKS